VGDAAWGLQFHPEVTEAIIRDWCTWDRSTQEQSEKIVSEFSCIEETYRATSRLLLHNFLGAH
jgi:GMP synthase-like glutamine amidotransferase